MLSISNLIFNIAPFTELLHKRMSACESTIWKNAFCNGPHPRPCIEK